MPDTVELFGIDVTDHVVAWGAVEQIKEVLLADAQLLTSETSITFDNTSGFLSPRGGQSIVGGVDWLHKLLTLKTDGVVIFEGYLKSIEPTPETKEATVTAENVLAKPVGATYTGAGAGVNPAIAALAILRSALPDEQIDADSFRYAAGPARQAGATIDYTFAEGGNVTVADAIQEIGALASIAFYVQRGRLYARAFRPYQGDGSELKFAITDELVREWGEFGQDNASFNNRVAVGYAVGPPELYVRRQDDESYRVNGREWRTREFAADADVSAANEASAAFFCDTYLGRASHRRTTLGFVGGPELKAAAFLGDRFPVTQVEFGLSDAPMEAIEVRPRLGSDEVELLVVGVKAPS